MGLKDDIKRQREFKAMWLHLRKQIDLSLTEFGVLLLQNAIERNYENDMQDLAIETMILKLKSLINEDFPEAIAVKQAKEIINQ